MRLKHQNNTHFIQDNNFEVVSSRIIFIAKYNAIVHCIVEVCAPSKKSEMSHVQIESDGKYVAMLWADNTSEA